MSASLLPAIADLAAARRAAGDADHRATWGQFFTPPAAAALLASRLRARPGAPLTILDPGAGAGILGAAAVEAAFAGGASSVQLLLVEQEPGALQALAETTALLGARFGDRLRARIVDADFLALPLGALPPVNAVICNPPWQKRSPADRRGGDAPNAYARFMERAGQALVAGGQALFVAPRSFASGLYFQRFRLRFHATMSLEWAHLFASRRAVFSAERVLQETLLLDYRRGAPGPDTVLLSSSRGPHDPPVPFEAPRALIFRPGDPLGTLHLPLDAADADALRAVQAWPGSLHALGLAVRTGPVVPFRTGALRRAAGPDTAPLLWMQHVHPGELRWPLGGSFPKAEHIARDARALLVPNQGCVLLRRFSSKDEARRLVAAALPAGRLPGDWLGLENHLNMIYRPDGALSEDLATGLAALLSSRRLEAWFRVQSGNTQVSATELRAMPLPDAAAITALGRRVLAGNTLSQIEKEIDQR